MHRITNERFFHSDKTKHFANFGRLTGVDLIDGELFHVKTILNVLQVVFRVTVRRASLTHC